MVSISIDLKSDGEKTLDDVVRFARMCRTVRLVGELTTGQHRSADRFIGLYDKKLENVTGCLIPNRRTRQLKTWEWPAK